MEAPVQISSSGSSYFIFIKINSPLVKNEKNDAGDQALKWKGQIAENRSKKTIAIQRRSVGLKKKLEKWVADQRGHRVYLRGD